MATRLTLAVTDDCGAATLYRLLEEELQKAVYGEHCQLIRRDRLFIELVDRHSNEGEKLKPGFIHIAANAIADYFVDKQETRLLRRMIANQFEELTKEDAEEVLQYCKELLCGTAEMHENHSAQFGRKADISRKTAAYLSEHSYLDVDGFYRFRLGSYRADLKDIVEYAIDEYVSNRQYQEFISLLKYFVYFQDAKIPKVHLIHFGGNRYTMLDQSMRPIEPSLTEEVVVETIDKELNYEDMIVSTLISASPRHVTIHTRDPETLSIRTIRQIFEGRTTICTGCKCCTPMLGERQAEAGKGSRIT